MGGLEEVPQKIVHLTTGYPFLGVDILLVPDQFRTPVACGSCHRVIDAREERLQIMKWVNNETVMLCIPCARSWYHWMLSPEGQKQTDPGLAEVFHEKRARIAPLIFFELDLMGDSDGDYLRTLHGPEAKRR